VTDSLRLTNILVISNKGNVSSHHVVRQVLEITAQLKKISKSSRGCICGVLSHHCVQTELFPTGNTHLKKISALQPA